MKYARGSCGGVAVKCAHNEKTAYGVRVCVCVEEGGHV
jgi:hypothetical protein